MDIKELNDQDIARLEKLPKYTKFHIIVKILEGFVIRKHKLN